MILETKEEAIAYDWLMSELSDEFSRRGCNDLPDDIRKQLPSIKMERKLVDGTVDRITDVQYDSDLIEFLNRQKKVQP